MQLPSGPGGGAGGFGGPGGRTRASTGGPGGSDNSSSGGGFIDWYLQLLGQAPVRACIHASPIHPSMANTLTLDQDACDRP